MADDGELEVLVAFKEEVSKGLKTVNSHLKKIEGAAEGAFGQVTKKARQTEDQVERSSSALGRFSVLLANVGKGAALAGLAIGLTTILGLLRLAQKGVRGLVRGTIALGRVSVRAMGALAKEFREVALGLDDIAKKAVQVGASTKFLTAMRLAADLTGTSLTGMTTALRVGAKNLIDYKRGVGEARESLNLLGITNEDIESKMQTTGDFLVLVAERWHTLEDELTKTAVAQRLFGRSGSALRPLLEEGADGIRRYMDEAERLGIVFSRAELKRVENFNDELTRVETALRGIKERAVVEFAPALTKVAEAVTSAIVKARGMIQPFLDDVVRWVNIAAEFIPSAFSLAWDYVTANTDEALGVMRRAVVASALAIGVTLVQAFITSIDVITEVMKALMPAGMKFALGLVLKALVDAGAFMLRQVLHIAAGIVAAFTWAWDQVKAGVLEMAKAVIKTLASAFDSLGMLNPLAGPLGVALSKLEGMSGKTKDFAEHWRESAEAAGDLRGEVDRVASGMRGLIDDAFMPTPEEIETALKEGVGAAGPSVQEFFKNAATALSGVVSTTLGSGKGISPAFEKLLVDMQARLNLAVETVDAEEQLTEELKEQKGLLNEVASAAKDFGAGMKAALFGFQDSAGTEMKGILEELRDNFMLGAETARSAVGGMQDAFRGLFLDLTDGTTTAKEAFQNFLMGVLDLARNISAELVSILAIRSILAALEPAGDAASTTKTLTAAAAMTAAGASVSAGAAATQLAAVELGGAGAVVAAAATEMIFAAMLMKGSGFAVAAADGGVFPAVKTVKQITAFADGGIRKDPTMAIFAEAGAEAFVPLPDGRSIPVTMTAPNGAQGAPQAQQSGDTDARHIEFHISQQITAPDRESANEVAARSEEAIRDLVVETLVYDDRARAAVAGTGGR